MESKPIVLGPSMMDTKWFVTDHPPLFLTSLVLPPPSSSEGEVKHDSVVKSTNWTKDIPGTRWRALEVKLHGGLTKVHVFSIT